MKSLNKHVPTIVFAMGLALLLFSMRAFFYPSVMPAAPRAPVRVTPSAPSQTAPAPAVEPNAGFMAGMHKISPRPPQDLTVSTRDFVEKLAENHLKSVGLRMTLPKDMQFSTSADGPIRILMGSNGPDRVGLYLFSVKGKYSADRASKYLKDYFKDEFDMVPHGQGSSYRGRGGFSDMTLFKGGTSRGEEYQAYFFRDAGSHETHMLVLMDSQLSRHPARIRELVDSLRPYGK